jgi:hypothetical protein
MTPADYLKLATELPSVSLERLATGMNINVGGKPFATTAEPSGVAVLKFSSDQQAMLCAAEPDLFTVSPSQWGRHGWTRLDVTRADEDTVSSALRMAWANRASRRLREWLANGDTP